MTDRGPVVRHIGVAVSDLAAAVAFYREVLGVEPTPAESADGATIVSLPFGETAVELLVPETPESPVAKFLARRGPAIHHVCFRVPNLDEALVRCRTHGYRLVDERPRAGAGGHRVAFLHPKSTAGILLELTE
ncbi:MAG: methylmalonyl-CoA epimerase [Gemmatimonadetes bacterium]|nr:methylmalonyl-CoA epimerase [Gemmatimonadota bacterium]